MAAKTRDETKAETREALLLAALELFVEEGLHGPSLHRICDRAGRTRGAFYVHFEDREALTRAVVERVWKAWVDAVLSRDELARSSLTGSFASFTHVFASVFSDASDDPFLGLGVRNVGLMMVASSRDPVMAELVGAHLRSEGERLTALIRHGQDDGSVRQDVAAEVLAELLVTVVLGIVMMAPAGFPGSVPTLAQAVFQLLTVPVPT